MLEHKRMQSDRGAEQGNNFQLRLHAVDPEKWDLIRSFATVDGQIASVHAEAERDRVKFAEFDAAARGLLKRGEDSAANQPMKRSRSTVPVEPTNTSTPEP